MKSIKFSTFFPFGLLKKRWKHIDISDDKNDGMVVYPQILKIDAQKFIFRNDRQAELSSLDVKGEGTSVYGLREYHESDNPKKINWKASAKRVVTDFNPTAGWVVREMESEQNEQVNLKWPSFTDLGKFSDDKLEMFVSYTASLVQSLCRMEREVKFYVPVGLNNTKAIRSARTGPSEKPIMEFLSLIDFKNNKTTKIQSSYEETSQVNIQAVDIEEAFQNWLKEKSRGG